MYTYTHTQHYVLERNLYDVYQLSGDIFHTIYMCETNLQIELSQFYHFAFTKEMFRGFTPTFQVSFLAKVQQFQQRNCRLITPCIFQFTLTIIATAYRLI